MNTSDRGEKRARVVVTRGSVCLGDDSDAPHEKTITVSSSLSPEEFVHTLSKGYLPSVAGTSHTWTCLLNGEEIARIAVTNTQILVRELCFATENRVHFVYHSRAGW